MVSELLKTVEERKQLCFERQWKYTRRNGDVVMIRDSLNKVAEWVKRFQEVGDSVMQYDTGHAALLWAGVRLLLNFGKRFKVFILLTILSGRL